MCVCGIESGLYYYVNQPSAMGEEKTESYQMYRVSSMMRNG